MKYEVIGWTYCGNDMYPPHNDITASVDKAIIAEIRKHKYLFGGDAHERYAPLLNDGTYADYSWRGWGRIIALAYGVEGDYSYMCGYMDSMIKPKARKYPEGLPDDSRIVPKESLTETFVMHLSDEMFEKVKAGTKTVELRLFDDKSKDVDIGDFIEFVKSSDERERVIRRVVNLYPYESFKKLFAHFICAEGKEPSPLLTDFTAAQAGLPANADSDALAEEMHKYYDQAQEKEHGVIAFWLDEAKHTCQTKLRIYRDTEECLELYGQKLAEAEDDKEFERLYNEALDSDLIEAALGEISADFKKFWHCYEYGENRDYNVDVNVMIRKTLENLFGKEEKLKEVQDRYCVIIELEIFALIVKDSEEPGQNLTLDKDIKEFLDKSGIKLNLGRREV